MHVVTVGRRAALVEVDDAGQALSLALWVRERVTAEDVVPAARTVLVDGIDDVASLAALLAGWTPGPVQAVGALVEVEVTYDGPDLATVGEAWGIGPDDVALRHAAREYVVAFCGFAPGFGYLTGLPARCDVPRRPTPRTAVPAGSVALAGPYTGVYPRSSPGGWQLIGTTDLVLWDPARVPAALLSPGARVRFVPVGATGSAA